MGGGAGKDLCRLLPEGFFDQPGLFLVVGRASEPVAGLAASLRPTYFRSAPEDFGEARRHEAPAADVFRFLLAPDEFGFGGILADHIFPELLVQRIKLLDRMRGCP